jgi:hypothetical protein
LIVPSGRVFPDAPLNCQLTGMLASNCWVAPAARVTNVGEIVTELASVMVTDAVAV